MQKNTNIGHEYLSSLFKSFDARSCILLPNQRIAAELIDKFTAQQNPKAAWQSPNIFAWQTWLETTWLELRQTDCWQEHQLLNQLQEYSIWLSIIKKNLQVELVNLQDTVKLVKTTNDLINTWQIPSEKLVKGYSLELDQFLLWQKIFNKHQQDKHLVVSSELAGIISNNLSQLKASLPDTIYFGFFSEMVPALAKLRVALAEFCQLEELQHKQDHTKKYYYQAKDNKQELIDLMHWAKQKYQSGHKKIGCVVSNLANIRDQVEDLATEHLLVKEKLLDFDISAGIKLMQCNIVNNAIALAKTTKKMNLAQWLFIINSPYIKGKDEKTPRIKLCEYLQASNIDNIDANSIINLANNPHKPYYSPTLASVIENVILMLPNKQLYPSQAIDLMTNILAAYGWPGEHTIDSEEYQAYMKFSNTLESMYGLEYIINQTSLSNFASLLENHLSNTDFQLEKPKAAIEFLGILEAAGREFDCMWVTNCTSDNWPKVSDPNPFIPIEVQKKYQIPHSSAERELFFSKNILATFSSQTQELVCSYGFMDNEVTQFISPLITTYQPYDYNIHIEPTREYTRASSKYVYEYLEDYQSSPVEQSTFLQGGASILSDQVACGFKAFARHRLNIKEDSNRSIGISYLARGIMLHHLLEMFWRKTRNLNNLLSLSSDELHSTLDSLSTIVIQTQLSDLVQQHNQQLLAIEQRRLLSLASEWLEFEKSRESFTCHVLEQQVSMQFTSLKINLRIDRIDKIDDKYWIIDYKSKVPTNLNWLDPRPDNPQMLIYLLASNLPMDGILLAQVKLADMLFRGVKNQHAKFVADKIISEDIEKWSEQLQKWHHDLHTIANEFTSGNALAQPKYVTTCSQCSYHILCRINDNYAE